MADKLIDGSKALAIKGDQAVPVEAKFNIGEMPASLAEAIQFANLIATSDFIPVVYKGKPGNILAAWQMGAELGLKPLAALQNIAVINGRPSLWGDVMLGIIKAHHSCEFVHEDEADMSLENPIATCTSKRKGQPLVIRTFSMEDAKRAGLVDANGRGRGGSAVPWSTYPKRMLQMRARGFNLRDNWPDLLRGLWAAEEAQDIPTDDNWREYLDGSENPQPKTRTEQVKDKMRGTGPEDNPTAEPDDLLDQITRLDNYFHAKNWLGAHAKELGALSQTQQKAVMAAHKTRTAILKAQAKSEKTGPAPAGQRSAPGEDANNRQRETLLASIGEGREILLSEAPTGSDTVAIEANLKATNLETADLDRLEALSKRISAAVDKLQK